MGSLSWGELAKGTVPQAATGTVLPRGQSLRFSHGDSPCNSTPQFSHGDMVATGTVPAIPPRKPLIFRAFIIPSWGLSPWQGYPRGKAPDCALSIFCYNIFMKAGICLNG